MPQVIDRAAGSGALRFGAVFPTSDIGDDPIAIRDYAQGLEELGYDHLIAYDHVLGAEHADREPALTGPYDEHTAFHEPFVLFGYLAGLTRALELIAGVIVLPQRQTALVAKQAAEVAILSSGRLRLGVGTGWNWVEYDALGVPFRGRAERLEEQVELLRRLWAEPLVTTHTGFHDIERAGILPRPAATIPIVRGRPRHTDSPSARSTASASGSSQPDPGRVRRERRVWSAARVRRPKAGSYCGTHRSRRRIPSRSRRWARVATSCPVKPSPAPARHCRPGPRA